MKEEYDYKKCINKECTAFDIKYEYNCSINGFTFAIGCKQYIEEK
jgi:hypothetical protein